MTAGTIAGVTAAAVAGGLVWRKKRAEDVAQPEGDSGPGTEPNAACAVEASAYQKSRSKLINLRNAVDNLSRQLRRTEIIQANNVMKANILVGYEVGTMVGGTVGELTGVLIRSAQLRVLAAAARNRAARLKSELEAFQATLEERIAATAVVREAEELFRDATGRLTRAEQLLPKAETARQGVEEAEKWLESSGRACAIDLARREAIEEQIMEARSQLNNLRKQVDTKVGYAQRDLKAVQDEIQSLTQTVDAQGHNPTLSGPLERQLDDLKDREMYFQDQLHKANQEVAGDVAKIPEVEAKIAGLQTDLENVKAEQKWSLQQQDQAMQYFDYQKRQVQRYEDMTQGTVDALRRDEWATQAKVDSITAKVRGQMTSDLAAQQAGLEEAARAAASADARLQQAYSEAEQLTASAQLEPLYKKLMLFPFRLVARLIGYLFGSMQSPEEIVEILRKGAENIKLLHNRLNATERAADIEYTNAQRLHSELDKCIKSHSGSQTAPPNAPQPQYPGFTVSDAPPGTPTQSFYPVDPNTGEPYSPPKLTSPPD